MCGDRGHGGSGVLGRGGGEAAAAEEGDEQARFEDDTDSFMLRRREFCFPGIPPIVLRQEFVSVDGTGGAVWRSSIQFATFVCGEEGKRCLPLAGRSVLEVSSGLGLGAIAAWHLGASPVVATDVDEENGPMALLSYNAVANCSRRLASVKNHGTSAGGERDGEESCLPLTDIEVDKADGRDTSWAKGDMKQPLHVRALRWGSSSQLADAMTTFEGFGPDVVLACDVIFDESLLPDLSDTLAGACVLKTREGKRPTLCMSHQRRNRGREGPFFANLSTRLGGGAWEEVHREDDLSVFIFRGAVA